MATNPMQRKSRNALIIGIIIGLLVAALVGVLAYMQIKKKDEEIKKYQSTTRPVRVLMSDVKSGQVLDESMFLTKYVPVEAVPADSDISAQMSLISLCTDEGVSIITGIDSNGMYYYYIGSETNTLYKRNSTNGELTKATDLYAGEKAYYKDSNGAAKEVRVSNNTVVAKIDLSANTIVTSGMIARGDERATSDMRLTEYNVVSLPVDLMSDEYIDVRLKLPTGEDYIVVSKKQITIPMSNGEYLADTIQMKLTEDEILTLSGAIVEKAEIQGAQLYATRYVEAGLQTAASVTYYPSNEIVNLINSDPNIVSKSIEKIREKAQKIRDGINNAANRYGDKDKITTSAEASEAAALEARKQYLQSLSGN